MAHILCIIERHGGIVQSAYGALIDLLEMSLRIGACNLKRVEVERDAVLGQTQWGESGMNLTFETYWNVYEARVILQARKDPNILLEYL